MINFYICYIKKFISAIHFKMPLCILLSVLIFSCKKSNVDKDDSLVGKEEFETKYNLSSKNINDINVKEKNVISFKNFEEADKYFSEKFLRQNQSTKKTLDVENENYYDE